MSILTPHEKFKLHFPEIKEELLGKKADLVKLTLRDRVIVMSFRKEEIEKRLKELTENFDITADIKYSEEIVGGKKAEKAEEVLVEGALSSPGEAVDFLEFYEEKVNPVLNTRLELKLWEKDRKFMLKIEDNDFYWVE